jgi:hypothetical protein
MRQADQLNAATLFPDAIPLLAVDAASFEQAVQLGLAAPALPEGCGVDLRSSDGVMLRELCRGSLYSYDAQRDGRTMVSGSGRDRRAEAARDDWTWTPMRRTSPPACVVKLQQTVRSQKAVRSPRSLTAAPPGLGALFVAKLYDARRTRSGKCQNL